MYLFTTTAVYLLTSLWAGPQADIAIPGTPATLMEADGSSGTAYTYLDADTPHSITLDGPQRVRIESRALIQEGVRRYVLPVHLNGKLDAVFRFQSSADPSRTIRHHDRQYAVGFRRFGTVIIPEGRHTLTLEASGQTFIRLSLATRRDLLFPQLNQQTETVVLQPGDLAFRLPLAGDPGGVLKTAVNQIGDPRYRDSTLAGLAALAQEAMNLNDPALLRQVDLERQYLRYQTILPYKSEQSHRLTPLFSERNSELWFTQPIEGTYNQASYRLEERPFAVPARLLVEVARDLPMFEITSGDGQPVSYQITTHEDRRFGRIVFDIPAGCKRLQIKQTTGKQAAPICLQIAGGAFASLQEPELRFFRDRLGGDPLQWMIQWLDGVPHETKDPLHQLAQEQVARHFFALKRRVDRTQAFETSTFSYPTLAQTYSQETIDKGGREALPHAYLRARNSGEVHDWLALSRALIARNEFDMAEDILRWLAQEHPEARETLDAFLLKHREGAGLLARRIQSFKQNPNPQTLTALMEGLHLSGEQHMANGLATFLDMAKPKATPSWREAKPAVTHFAAGTTLYNSRSDRTSRAFRLNPNEHIKLMLSGAQKLRLEIRPLHPKDAPPLNDTARIFLNDGLVPVPIIDNRPSQSVSIKSGSRFFPGRPVYRVLNLTEGTHTLVVKAGDAGMTLRFHSKPQTHDDMADAIWQQQLADAVALGTPRPQPNNALQAIAYLDAGSILLTAEALMAEAAQLRDHFEPFAPLDARVRQLIGPGHWQTLRTVHQSAGLRTLPSGATANDHRFHRQALVAPARRGEHLIRGEARQHIDLPASETPIVLQFAVDGLAAFRPTPVAVVLRLDREKVKEFDLHPNGVWREIALPHAGGKRLRVEINGAGSRQFTRLQISPTPKRRAPDTWFAATHKEPIQLKIFEPTWLRIETYDTEVPGVRYQAITDTPTTLTFEPEGNQSIGLYRFARRVMGDPQPEAEPSKTPAYDLLPVANFRYAPPSFAEAISQTPADGTWSFTSLSRSRQLSDDDEGLSRYDRFQEGNATWRGRIWNGHSRMRLLWRERDEGGRTLGLNAGHTWTSGDHYWRANLSAYQQAGDRGAWSLYGRINWSKDFQLGDKLKHRPEVELFGRSLSAPQTLDERVDLDVYSTYKDNHRSGLRLYDSLIWRPFDDSWFDARLGLVTNEDMTSLERGSLALTWSQLLGPFQVTLGVDGRHYFADNNRANAFNRTRYFTDVSWSKQNQRTRRWELRLRYEANDRGQDNVALSLNWIFGDTGDFYHYAPREVRFRGLKRERHQQGGTP